MGLNYGFKDVFNVSSIQMRQKIISSSRAVKILSVAMVTNMISQLQESFLLRRAAGSFQISSTKWHILRSAVTREQLVTELRRSVCL